MGPCRLFEEIIFESFFRNRHDQEGLDGMIQERSFSLDQSQVDERIQTEVDE